MLVGADDLSAVQQHTQQQQRREIRLLTAADVHPSVSTTPCSVLLYSVSQKLRKKKELLLYPQTIAERKIADCC